MRKRWLWIGVVALVAGGLITVAWAAGAGGGAPLDGGAVRGQGGMRGGLRWLREKLTPEQQAEVQARVQALRKQGAAPPEIRAAVMEMLKGWGIALPQPPPAPQ